MLTWSSLLNRITASISFRSLMNPHGRSNPSELPAIAIIGTTGVGKSKLAIQLAQYISSVGQNEQGSTMESTGGWDSAEIINADSIQIFKGLDVITNKVTEEEMQNVPHRLIGVVDPRGERGWGMKRWVEVTMDEISELHAQRSIPLITGGTTYWVQHLLFPLGKPSTPSPLSSSSTSTVHVPFRPTPSPSLSSFLSVLPEPLLPAEKDLLESLPSLPLKPDEKLALPLHELLRKLDPILADKWHWRDTRKVLRGLESVWNEGKRESEVWMEQARKKTENQDWEKKRYRTLIFWLYAPSEILNPRLDSRIDKMIELGLLPELREMREIADEHASSLKESTTQSDPNDSTSGIFQAIGYKEFSGIPTKDLTTEAADTIPFKDAVERMKMTTRQYAKSQVKWITGKLGPEVEERVEREREGLFLLDASDLEKWDDKVLAPALSVLRAFLNEQPLPSPTSIGGSHADTLLSSLSNSSKSTLPKGTPHRCELCSTLNEPYMVMLDPSTDTPEGARVKHERGKRHQSILRKMKRAEEAPRYEELRREARKRADLKALEQDKPKEGDIVSSDKA